MFALIFGGAVIEVAAAEFPVHADFAWVDVSAVTPTPQIGWAYAEGAFTAPASVTPSLAQEAAVAAGAGVTLTISGSLTLAATLFPTDPVTQGKLASVITTLGATGAFPGGSQNYPMKDSAGAWHTLTVAQYKAVAGAIATYVAALDLIADGNPMSATLLPSSSVSLTV